MLQTEIIPHLYPYIYLGASRKKPFLFHPFTDKKIVFIQPFEQKALRLADGKNTIGGIYEKMREDFPGLELSDLRSLFTKLLRLNVAYTNAPKKRGYAKHWYAIRVWFHLTNQCNLRCESCYVAKTPQKMTVETGYRALEELFISAKKNHYKALNIRFAGGEPLLEVKNLLLFSKKCFELQSKYGIRPQLAIITNGVLLTEKVAEQLKKARIVVVVSLDGLGVYNDKNRHFANGEGAFERAMQGIRTAQKYKIFRCVAITVTSGNVKHLPAFITYLAKRDIAFFLSFYRTPFAGPDKLIPQNTDLIASLKKTYRILKKYPPRLGFFSTTLDTVLSPCGVGENQVIIDWTGEVKECQMITKKIDKIPGKDYLTSIRLKSFTREYNRLLSKTACGTCRWNHICTSGCAVMHYAQLKKAGKLIPPNYCATYKTLIPAVIEAQASLIERNVRLGLEKELVRHGLED